MKVVIFCGGQGVRLREYGRVPKPMIPIGSRPILWHVMRYYAHFGHTEFILCLGYGAAAIKEYFLHYKETLSNDFVLTDGGRSLELAGRDIEDWKITFADTGLHATIGERLIAARRYLAGDDVFLATYGDCLTDAPLGDLIRDFTARDAVAGLLSVTPPGTFDLVDQGPDGSVVAIGNVAESGRRMNGGFFLLRPSIFDHLGPGEELVVEGFQRLVAEGLLIAYPWDGFWATMDTLNQHRELEGLNESGRPPWAVWATSGERR